MSGRLDGKVAIVTGGGSGFGRATALRFAAEGARVVIGDLDEAGGRATIDEIAERLAIDGASVGRIVAGDVSDPAVAARLVETALESFGTLTTLVNNAGIAEERPATPGRSPPRCGTGSCRRTSAASTPAPAPRSPRSSTPVAVRS